MTLVTIEERQDQVLNITVVKYTACVIKKEFQDEFQQPKEAGAGLSDPH